MRADTSGEYRNEQGVGSVLGCSLSGGEGFRREATDTMVLIVRWI